MEIKKGRNWNIFLSSVFFVLGFSIVFSLLGILLQTILVKVSYSVQIWLGRIGGLIIIFLGLVILDLINPSFLMQEHKFRARKFRSVYLTSFIFGAAFAFAWTPCVGPALGAILILAATNSSSAFLLLLSYSIGLGIPFLLVGLFANEAQGAIKRAGKWILYFRYIFGAILIIMGILMFTNQLTRIANFQFLTNFLTTLNVGISSGGYISNLSFFNLGIAFIAGVGSFLSPCVLPLIPGYLSYLASVSLEKPVKNE